ncbi:MAG TPA: hypothetical protein VG711_07945 [Phycisphaerales bacterium]|nr:hypothetical protein [Phycisphaerales bacterium]
MRLVLAFFQLIHVRELARTSLYPSIRRRNALSSSLTMCFRLHNFPEGSIISADAIQALLDMGITP